jgi:transcription initiation factor TFIID TATA-box-binding protein
VVIFAHLWLFYHSCYVILSTYSFTHPTRDFRTSIMDSLTTHPSNAQQARAFTSTASLSFPGGAGDLTPPGSDKEAMAQMNGQAGGNAVNGTGVTPASPATPAATPGATTGSSGIVPTLQ